GIKRLLFSFRAGPEGLPKLSGHESGIELPRQDQRRTGRERPGPAGPFRPSRRVDTYDFREVFLIEGVVVRRFVYFGDLEAGLEGRLERLRELIDVPLVRFQRLCLCFGLLVKLACTEHAPPAALR